MVALKVESWTWYGFVISVWLSRVISRRMTLGSFRKFQIDDYIMGVAIAFYTPLIVTINIVANTSSNLLPPGTSLHFSPQDRQERIFGSKLILVVEQCQCVTIWCAKICLVLLYLRITSVHREHLAVKILLGYVLVTFVVMDILYFGVWCQPFHNYWALPTPNPQCDAATNHLITNAAFNLSSDTAMLLIGLPMFLRMKLPWRKKIPMIGIFSLGVFTILSAVLNKWYSFTQPFGAQWTHWYTRESSTALLVANLPFVWTFWRRIATGTNSIKGQSRHDSLSPEDALSRNENGGLSGENKNTRASAEDLEMSDAIARGRRMTFAEMLDDVNPSSMSGKEPNEFTHPALFYSKNRGGSAGNIKPPAKEHAQMEELEFQTVHGETNQTPASSVCRHLKSKESMNSFV